MKSGLCARRFGFIILLASSFFSFSCSSNTSLATHKDISALPENTPENCEVFAGEWLSNSFKKIEDEKKIICGDKPCIHHNTGGSGFRLTCADGKISGEVILHTSAQIISYSNTNQGEKAILSPQPIIETKTSFKDIRIENGALYLSYSFGNGKNCLKEISVSPKGKFLLGKYQISGCQRLSDYYPSEKGSILFSK